MAKPEPVTVPLLMMMRGPPVAEATLSPSPLIVAPALTVPVVTPLATTFIVSPTLVTVESQENVLLSEKVQAADALSDCPATPASIRAAKAVPEKSARPRAAGDC